MKKLILCLVLLYGGLAASEVVLAVPIPGPTCPADSPCLYTGKACQEDGSCINISVHRLNDYTTDLVAKFEWGGKTETAYVFSSGIGDGRWYFNWKGKKYWFEM